MDPQPPDDDERLRALGDALRGRTDQRDTSGGSASNMAIGLKYASEFAGAVIVGVLLGYFLDRFANTSPWGLLGGLFLGSVSGVYTIVRSAQTGMNDAGQSAQHGQD